MNVLDRFVDESVADDLADQQEEARRERPRWWLCRGCRRRITDEAREFEIDGQYVHRRINPHGIHFEFFIFTGAPGCTTSSRPTEDFSWFDGYLWEIAACANCHEHLGWRFSSILGLSFYGLLCAKLTKETDD